MCDVFGSLDVVTSAAFWVWWRQQNPVCGDVLRILGMDIPCSSTSLATWVWSATSWARWRLIVVCLARSTRPHQQTFVSPLGISPWGRMAKVHSLRPYPWIRELDQTSCVKLWYTFRCWWVNVEKHGGRWADLVVSHALLFSSEFCLAKYHL